MKIRTGTIDDLDALMKLERDLFPKDACTRATLRRHLQRKQSAFLVAIYRARVVGYSWMTYHANGLAYLYGICSTKPGTGRLLLDKAGHDAVKRGCIEIQLNVREDNVRAISLYERSGYKKCGRKKHYYGPGEAGVTFLKIL